MTTKSAFIIATGLALAASAPAYAQQGGGQGAQAQKAQAAQQQDLDRTAGQDQVYGYQLMTQEERSVYRNAMRSFSTQQEREAFRLEHHRKMQQRAAERGVKLPDVPPGAGAGMGPGAGMGRGAGMGPGAGRGAGLRNQPQVQSQPRTGPMQTVPQTPASGQPQVEEQEEQKKDKDD